MKNSRHLPLWLPLLALGVASCGGGVESDIEEAQNTLGIWSPELAERMLAHSGDPRVPDLVLRELEARAGGGYAGVPPDGTFDALGKIVIAP